jgi:serine/threonine protein kinase
MLPVPRELREIPNWPDRKDGVIVDGAMLDKTRKVLKAYYEAWEEHVGERADSKIKEMAKIAMTLNIIKARTHLDKFLWYRYDESFFPFKLRVLKRDIFDDSSDAQRFYNEQFRVASRDWSGGDRIDLNEGEPIPFKIDQIFEPGSFSSVQRVRNVHTNKSYAIKYPNEKANGAERHMENEIIHLREVCNKDHVPHIVRVEKVFTRGREFAVLMSPAATTNLQRILERFVKDVPARQYLRGEFLKGFGCLSHTLCYMHNDMNTRHRDIKPQNILFDWPNNESRYTRFLWSDFGLAQKFSIQEGSATNSRFNRGTEKYVAPEVLTDKEKHGRSADVFSFGCVMFEVLGCILGEEYDTSIEAPETSFPKRFHPHHNHIEQMHTYLDHLRAGQEHKNLEHLVLAKWFDRKLKVDDFLSRWSSTTKKDSSANKCLTPLLDLTKRMTNEKPQDRPKIDEVVVELATMHYQGLDVFCPACFDEVKTGYREKRAFMHRGEKRKSWRHFWSSAAAPPSRKVKA